MSMLHTYMSMLHTYMSMLHTILMHMLLATGWKRTKDENLGKLPHYKKSLNSMILLFIIGSSQGKNVNAMGFFFSSCAASGLLPYKCKNDAMLRNTQQDVHDTYCTCSFNTEKPVTTMLTYPWKCTVLHCNHLGNTWKPLVLMTRHFDYCPSASEGDNQSVGSSAPVVSRCFPGGYNVKLYIPR